MPFQTIFNSPSEIFYTLFMNLFFSKSFFFLSNLSTANRKIKFDPLITILEIFCTPYCTGCPNFLVIFEWPSLGLIISKHPIFDFHENWSKYRKKILRINISWSFLGGAILSIKEVNVELRKNLKFLKIYILPHKPLKM